MIEALGAAIKEAKAAPETGPIVIHVESDPLLDAPELRVLVGRSGLAGFRARIHPAGYKTYTDHKNRQRKLLG